MAYPKFTIGPITMPQQWPVYHCFVQRIVEPDNPDKTEYQWFDVWGSTPEQCRRHAVDISQALNKTLLLAAGEPGA